MKLQQARVQNYKSIDDSEWVDFDDVVAMVGPNEAGKTAFLQALHKFQPVNAASDYDVTQEYPRRNLSEYRERHEENPETVVSVKTKLEEEEIELVESEYVQDILESDRVKISKNYKNDRDWELDFDEKSVISWLLEQYQLPTRTAQSLDEAETIDKLWEKIEASEAQTDDFPQLEDKVRNIRDTGFSNILGEEILEEYLPEFLYFDDYYTMEGKVCINDLVRKSQNDLTKGEETFTAFLSLADFSIEDLRELDDFEDLIAETEAVSSRLTEKVFEYWSQGPDLRIQIRDETQIENGNEITYLHIRIFNERHRNTLPFGERSRGFIWFFSFLAYFSNINTNDHNELVLLLDEPGLNLHAKAQQDLLRFINEELAPEHDVIYTTHSPFMLEANRLDRARLVEDRSEDDEIIGTKVSDDILNSGENAIFPLQAALGYDLVQTLLIGPETLLVEGPSDMRYIEVMSDILENEDRSSLDQKWTIVPVGGADKIPTFVSLFGSNGLTIGILLDSDDEIDERLEEVEDRGVIDLDNVETISSIIENEEGDVEDLFPQEFYEELVEGAYRKDLRFNEDVSEIDLSQMDFDHPRVTKKMERFFQRWHLNDGKFGHDYVAKHFQDKREVYMDEVPSEALDNFEELFEKFNSIVE